MNFVEHLESLGKDFINGLRVGFSSPLFRRSTARGYEDPKGSGKLSVKYKGKTYRRYKRGYGPYEKEERRLGKLGLDECLCECGETLGYYHYLGCDCEDCPICKGQLLSCGHGYLFETPGVRCS